MTVLCRLNAPCSSETLTRENEAEPYFRFQLRCPCLKDAAGKPRIVRHWRRGAAGASGGQSRGPDRGLPLRARQIVGTLVFRFFARACPVFPPRPRPTP